MTIPARLNIGCLDMIRIVAHFWPPQ